MLPSESMQLLIAVSRHWAETHIDQKYESKLREFAPGYRLCVPIQISITLQCLATLYAHMTRRLS